MQCFTYKHRICNSCQFQLLKICIQLSKENPTTESTSTNKFAQWIRPLIGGLLSYLVVRINPFFLDPVANLARFFSDSDVLLISISVLFWFAAGVLITRFSKTTKAAIGRWLLLYGAILLLLGSISFIIGDG